MSITGLGSLGEFVGSRPMLVTLAYSAVQIRQTKNAFHSASLWNRIATMNQNTENIAADPDYSETVTGGFYEHEGAKADLLATPGVAKWWKEFIAIRCSDESIGHVNEILASAEETEQFLKLRQSQMAAAPKSR